ncbi:MAG: GIY-YIG nuclease family protein [Ruminococcaceae bacterium]|nr:GIY-YIG nuclease family protein [Oscillospiraceae bacterium]
MYTPAEIKELEYLYKRHNKKWKKFELDVKESNIVFPKTVSKIINKEKPLIDREKDIRKKFRDKILRDLGIQSAIKQSKYLKEQEEKNRAIAQRKKSELDTKNSMDENKIKHFGIWKLKSNSLKINRETYAVIDNRNHGEKKEIERRQRNYKLFYDAYKNIYTDETCLYYKDEWCIKHREQCLENFDLNMKFMDNLSQDEFNKQLHKLQKKYKDIKEIVDLYEVESVAGVYIMVLDEYKQMYIGQSENIKNRIENHWSRKKPFDRLLFGRVDSSVLSIDSFGALDTTRIFVYPTSHTYEIEKKLVDFIDNKYILNRVGGGITAEDIYGTMEMLASMNIRNLKQG